jgi:peptidoglycan/xylan/chitin deacetylase (PgdA/CDA1 family)
MRHRRLPVFMYHSISQLANDPNMLCTSPEVFYSQMHYLACRGWRGVSMQKLRRAALAGSTKGLVGITFDDGYEDFLHTAVPIMEGFGFSATVFVVAGMLGQENDWEHAHSPTPNRRLLGAEGVREVVERGMEVGSHTMSHPSLPDLNPELLEAEVGSSRQVLSEVLGEEIEGFCYPYGRLDKASVRAVRRSRYTYACAVNNRVEFNDYDLPRMPIMASKDNSLRFAVKLKAYPHYSAAKQVAKRLLRPS